MRVDPAIWKMGTPPAPGYYATLACWDAIAGNVPDEIQVEDAGELFPGAHYWSGERWDADSEGGRCYDPIIRWHGPFGEAQPARTFAWEHEPNRPGQGMTDDEAGDLPEAGDL